MSLRQFLLAGVIALMGLALYDSVFEVGQRDTAAVFQFGQIAQTDLGPGLHFKLPFVQSVHRYDTSLQSLDRAGEDFLTSEKKEVQLGYYVKWRISNLATYYRATGGQPLSAADRLAPLVTRELRDQIGMHSIDQLVQDDGGQIVSQALADAGEKAHELGVEIVDIRIMDISLSDNVADSVYARMRAERARAAAEATAEGAESAEKLRAEADQQAQGVLSEANRQAETLRGEGDAQAAEIYAHAYGQDPDFFRFYRAMNAYRDSFKSGQDTLVLQPDSEFFRYFNQSGSARPARP